MMNDETKKKKRSAKSTVEGLPTNNESLSLVDPSLVDELRTLISQTQSEVARTVNSALVLMYWAVGTRIRTEVPKNERAEYGKQILLTPSTQLAAEFGRGFAARNLANMVALAEQFPEVEILQTLSAKLTWSHFVELIRVKQPLARESYAEMCRVENWSVRTLRANFFLFWLPSPLAGEGLGVRGKGVGGIGP